MTTSNGANGTHPATDPAVYADYESKWSSLPTDEAGWVKRAQEVAAVLLEDADVRERENKSPSAEVALLKHSGLTKVLGPKKFGGGEQPWSVGYKTIREVAKADGYVCGFARLLLSILCHIRCFSTAS